jgi:serine/threonine protein kinase
MEINLSSLGSLRPKSRHAVRLSPSDVNAALNPDSSVPTSTSTPLPDPALSGPTARLDVFDPKIPEGWYQPRKKIPPSGPATNPLPEAEPQPEPEPEPEPLSELPASERSEPGISLDGGPSTLDPVHAPTSSVHTISTEMGVFTLTKNCEDDNLITILKKENRLNPIIDNSDYKLSCVNTEDAKISMQLLGTGTFNSVYTTNNSDRVIRFTNKLRKIGETELTNEENGLFIQSYLSNIVQCNQICKVFEFGRYSLVPNIEFVSKLPAPSFMSARVGDTIPYRRGDPFVQKSGWYNVNGKLLLLDETGEYDYGEQQYTPVVSEQYVNGVYAIIEILPSDLFKYQEKIKIFDDNILLKIKQIFYDILSGLHCMHQLGYVHLDIKPENVGLTPDNRAKLFDMGTSTFLVSDKKYTTVGTLDFLDPYHKATQRFHIKSDIYAVGVMLNELFILDRYRNIKNRKNYANNAHLKNLIKGCLNKDPNLRYSAMDALSSRWFYGIPSPRVAKVSNSGGSSKNKYTRRNKKRTIKRRQSKLRKNKSRNSRR